MMIRRLVGTLIYFATCTIGLFVASGLLDDIQSGATTWVLGTSLLTALAYLISRGAGMAERSARHQRADQAATDDYIRTVAGGAASEIAQAKKLLNSGAINHEEFAKIKAAC